MLLREPSVRVHEHATEQLEERQSDWAYSKPIIFLDILWNLAFVGTAVVVLCLSVKEEPEVPLRLWLVGVNETTITSMTILKKTFTIDIKFE